MGTRGEYRGTLGGHMGGDIWGTYGEYMGDTWGTYGGHMGETIPPLDGGLSITRG